ncbi:DNA-directed RNA polymerase III subunit RPC7-like [Lingula anatina]|uniref:DNA-directed RNA polymerase III subunit n=1 Tax=Lingula anatina TaxID=7574 RepID=A0A1S3H164_LINAN|nr:DNA-directed RNA polymerase III subunit RPC7-like [Lingula anatina]|eukprot:XP_013379748.1 DNA-directed RNA polymerase III subunit RPC7-like [Lingula anatina]
MAGRGRGRGRGGGKGMSFSVETLGFGRGEALPAPTLQPPPLFPPLEFKPVALTTGEEMDYILALKQEFRATMKELPYYVKAQEKKKDIERYTDKYQTGQQDSSINWEPDWKRFPKELKIRVRKAAKIQAVVRPSLPKKTISRKADKDVLQTLEELEKKAVEIDAEKDEEDEEEKKEEDGEQEEEEEYDEEDLEEETDYNLNYFDNGEGYGMEDEDDNLDDGPTY